MPRQGDGSSDNVVEAGQNAVHGAASNDTPASAGVDKSHKAADPPAAEQGDGIQSMANSGGGSSGPTQSGSGKGGQ